MGTRVGVANFFLDQSIGIYENYTFQLILYLVKIVGDTGLGGLWALEWAWYPAETNLRYARSSGICMPNLNSLALIISEISAFIRTDEQTDMTRSTRLVKLIKNIYTLWGRKSLLHNTLCKGIQMCLS